MDDRRLPEGASAPDTQLEGGRCAQCGHFAVPRPATCPACLSEDVSPGVVDGEGTVYAATVVRSGPRDRPLPYGLAYVDLDAGIRVMAGYAVDDERPLEPTVRVVVSQVGESEAGLPLLGVSSRAVLAT